MRNEQHRQNLCATGVLCIYLGFRFQAYFDPIIWPVIGSRIGIGNSAYRGKTQFFRRTTSGFTVLALRLPFGLWFDRQPFPPFSLISGFCS